MSEIDDLKAALTAEESVFFSRQLEYISGEFGREPYTHIKLPTGWRYRLARIKWWLRRPDWLHFTMIFLPEPKRPDPAMDIFKGLKSVPMSGAEQMYAYKVKGRKPSVPLTPEAAAFVKRQKEEDRRFKVWKRAAKRKRK